LKLWPKVEWMQRRGYGLDTTHVVGLRADEPDRVSKLRERNEGAPWDVAAPLAAAGLTRDDVLAFWRAQPFDLDIPDGQGNCRGCFDKPIAQLRGLLIADPTIAPRYIVRERRIGGVFIPGYPFAALVKQTAFALPPAGAAPRSCACTD
jgi:hypothetical protein